MPGNADRETTVSKVMKSMTPTEGRNSMGDKQRVARSRTLFPERVNHNTAGHGDRQAIHTTQLEI
jgi:acyl dehydratase